MGDFRSIIFNFHTFKDFLDTLLLLLSNLFPIMLEKISSVRFQVFFFFLKFIKVYLLFWPGTYSSLKVSWVLVKSVYSAVVGYSSLENSLTSRWFGVLFRFSLADFLYIDFFQCLYHWERCLESLVMTGFASFSLPVSVFALRISKLLLNALTFMIIPSWQIDPYINMECSFLSLV